MIETPVFDSTAPVSFSDAVSDRVGGHYITYAAYGSSRSDIICYLHRIGGRSPWAAPLRLNEYPGSGAKIALTNDGVAIAWVETRTDLTINVLRFQKYSFAGAPLWPPSPTGGAKAFQVRGGGDLIWLSNGVSLFALAAGYTGPAKGEGYVLYRVSADGAVEERMLGRVLRGVPGNFFAAACTNRNRETIVVLPGSQVIAHKLSPTGELLWGTSGVSLTSDFTVKSSVAVACDRTGGATIAWSDKRRGPARLDFFAQRLDATGAPAWTAGGIEIARDGGYVGDIAVAPDESGGTFVVAIRHVNPEGITAYTVPRAYGFHIRADGRLDMGSGGGRRLDPIIGTAREVEVYPDGRGGAFAVWQARSSLGTVVDGVARPAHTHDIRCISHVWLTGDGTSVWGPEPARVGLCGAGPSTKKLVVSDGSVTSFFADFRSEYGELHRWTFSADVNGPPVLAAPLRPDRIITPRPAPTPPGAKLPPRTRPLPF